MSGARGRCAAWAVAAAAAVGLAPAWTAPCAAQVMQRREAPRAVQPPPTGEAVLRMIATPYLSDRERAEKRVFHGLWEPADLADPVLRARAALIAGVWDDPSAYDPRADPLDRAESALRRGEPEEALSLLEGASGARAARLRAESYESMGLFEEARLAAEPVAADLRARRVTSPTELVESVRALALLGRLEGRPARDYQTMLDLLVKAQQELDRLYWPALLAQAELLYEKDNMKEAGEAAQEVLTLNPSSAGAWRLLAEMSVDAFSFERAELIRDPLDRLARAFDGDPDAAHPWADLALARGWMRQSDPAYAQELVQRVLARFPDMREALALSAAASALTFDDEETSEALSRLDALSPGTPLGHYKVGWALAEARQYEAAAEHLNAASARQPNWPAPVIELGLMEMQSGRDTYALTALRRAVELDGYNTRARNSLALVEELAAYATVESPHFVVRHKPGIDGVMAREMIEPLEEIHRVVTGVIRHEPSRRTTIELLPDHRTFAVRIAGVTGIHTIAASTGPVIAMEAPKVGKLHSGVYDWVRVVQHEYAHTVTLSRTSNRIPHWFTEAAAVYCERSPRDYQTCQLLVGALTNRGDLSLFDMQEINIAFVRPKKQTDRAQAYAQGHWMYEFIVERWGEEAPLRLMDQYALGIKQEQAMPAVLGVSQADFVSEFERWARADAASWGMLPDPPLSALLLEETLADPTLRGEVGEALMAFGRAAAMRLAGLPVGLRSGARLIEPTPEVVDRMLARRPRHPDLLELKIGAELQVAGGAPHAGMIDLLERYAAARPVDPMPRRHLARLLLESDDPSRAIPHLEYLDAREQKSAAYAAELARRYAAIGDWDRAWRKAQRTTQIAPFDATYREFAAGIAVRRGDFDRAERHIEALTELEPQHDRHRERLRRVREMRAEAGR